MKQTFMLTLAAAATVAIVFSSCQPSRVWATKKKNKDDREYREREVYRQPAPQPARYNYSSALIITPTAGFVLKQSPGGRYYHRSPAGYLYWKGYDNRFYIDDSHLRDLRYSKWEYDEWKRYNRQSR